MTSLKSVQKRHQQLHAGEVRSLVLFRSDPLDEIIVNKLCFLSIFKVKNAFTPILRPDKHAELLKNNFKSPIKKLKFSTLIAKSDLRFKVH